MKKFKFKIKGSSSQSFEGEIEAYSIVLASEEIKDSYANELDTTPDKIEIVSLQEIIE